METDIIEMFSDVYITHGRCFILSPKKEKEQIHNQETHKATIKLSYDRLSGKFVDCELI